VYVFTRTGTVWTQEAYIKASNTGAGDQFGISVALSGDTLAVGARNESSNAVGINGAQNNDLALNSGAVYVFTRTGTVWTQQAYLKASNTGANDTFGSSVALSGDTLAVGASLESSNATGIGGDQNNDLAPGSGAVYVFTRTGTVWTQQAYIKASNTGANDFFGISVALSGDTLAVGANSEASNAVGINGNQNDNQLANSGAVYVLR
jgi:ABC-type transporter Mla maintaining outer membrane lipid asymmetry permease subunit MlaE